MLSRRDLLMGVPVAAQLRLVAAARPAPDAPQEPSPDLSGITSALHDLHYLTASTEVTQIRDKQRMHFKINQKFPAYIDIGLTVWEHLITWHLENHLPLTTRRTVDGRMEMDFMFTTLALKWEVGDAIIGVPYD
jgi:hypothetical protein